MGWLAFTGSFIAFSDVLELRLRRVGRASRGLVESEPVEFKVMGCFGMPKSSSRRAFGWSRCGWSANGRPSDIGSSKGSGGGQPRQRVDSERWKNECFLPLPDPVCKVAKLLDIFAKLVISWSSNDSVSIATGMSSSPSSFSFSS